ncbi:hypothetical protein [Bradyrhizobium elkanii]|uniref:hypothetical protein n=1 Tax=Bradyrhizobium elkanii TaxID=29448 RepID=UPI001485BE85|nr:hypothetical protein [Bradyrhizobium elkanii]
MLGTPQARGSFLLRAREQVGVFLGTDELQVSDAKVGERPNAIFADAIDSDQAVLDLHFDGNVANPVFVFTNRPSGEIYFVKRSAASSAPTIQFHTHS